MSEPEVTVFVCGGKAEDACPAGGQHDESGYTEFKDDVGRICGGSVSCSKCGSTAFDRDLMRLP